MRRSIGFFIVVLTLCLSLPLAWGGASKDTPARKTKLSAPQVTCVVSGAEVQVSWQAIPEAAAYQIEYTGTSMDGAIEKESEYANASPYAIDTGDYAALMVHVRALPPPKKAGKPQSGGPKGMWSDPCVAMIPYVDPR